jgi:hypothetical protein
MRKSINDKRIEMLENALRNVEFKRDSAITQNDLELVDNFNQQLDSLEAEIKSAEQEMVFKSSRFTRPKMRNVSQTSPVMGYAKPVQQQKISNKYHCIVSGEKRMNPCGGCSNPKGCLSSSMQYKEQNS